MAEQPKKIKQVYFNLNREKELLRYADDIDNFSDWVKEQLRRAIHEKQINFDAALYDQFKAFIKYANTKTEINTTKSTIPELNAFFGEAK